jgi:predicted AAA+ superfamily ATPase
VLQRNEPDRRRAWFESYITTILQRDVRDIANIRDLSEMPRLLALVASRAACLLDYSDLASTLSMPQTTLKRYMALLEATFLIQTVPAWFNNIGKRLAKSPKLMVNDTGLLTHLLGIDQARLHGDPVLAGGILENFVAMELLKQRGWSTLRPRLHHFRTYGGEEVDLVLEDMAGRIVGIEVKSTATVNSSHFSGLRALAELAGDRFHRGVVLHTGSQAVPFGKNLVAWPLQVLWSGG